MLTQHNQEFRRYIPDPLSLLGVGSGHETISLLTIAHGSKVTRINFRKEGEGLGSRLVHVTYRLIVLRMRICDGSSPMPASPTT